MNSKKFLVAALGAMLVCSGVKADGGIVDGAVDGVKAGLKWTGRKALFVSAETVGAVIASHGLKQAVKGVKQALPAVGSILLDTCLSIVGGEESKKDLGDLYGKALIGSLRGLYGAVVTCVSLFVMVDTVPAVDRYLAKSTLTPTGVFNALASETTSGKDDKIEVTAAQ